MAGRILPIALATIVGVSIGVATFDGEFKKQRLARMNDEYQQELAAAAAAASSANPTPATTSTAVSATQRQVQAKQEEAIASASPDNSWSNMLGLWAWKRDPKKEALPLKNSNEETKGKP
ncbi:hypothetical protein ACJQWK_11723 [Exserohilum turcicum]